MDKINLVTVFTEVEKAADEVSLPKRDMHTLQLLSEEMIKLAQSIIGDADSYFEVSRKGLLFELKLISRASVDFEKKKELIDISSSKKNVAAKGIIGKIRSVLEDIFSGNMPSGMISAPVGLSADGSYLFAWSMQRYISSLPVSERAESDNLERSIIEKMADEVIIGVSGNRVEMTVEKSF